MLPISVPLACRHDRGSVIAAAPRARAISGNRTQRIQFDEIAPKAEAELVQAILNQIHSRLLHAFRSNAPLTIQKLKIAMVEI